MDCVVERFSGLESLPFIRSAFIAKCPDLDVNTDRETALARLKDHHTHLRAELGFKRMPFLTAEQVHGNQIAIVKSAAANTTYPGVDGLLTGCKNLCLGIYVADCAAVYLVDKTAKAIALVHSGKKGTELGIVPAAIRRMRDEYGCTPENIIVQIAPCIRPPHYEVDFAKEIARQARAEGAIEVYDEETCTASHPDRYYSYRREMGKTGRMLALLALLPDAPHV